MATTTVTLQPGVPVTLAPQAVTGGAFASFTNDNTVAGGINAVAASAAVHLAWQATVDGVNWHQIAACSVQCGGTDPSSELGVSAAPGEGQVRLVAVQPSAVGPSVVLAPSVAATAVPA